MSEHSSRNYKRLRVHRNSFGYRGVEWDADRKKFRSKIQPKDGPSRWLGRFATAEAAAYAYDIAAKEFYGENCYLNFPLNGERKAISKMEHVSCPEGHVFSEHGTLFRLPEGRTEWTCRICNAAAVKRLKHKRRGL